MVLAGYAKHLGRTLHIMQSSQQNIKEWVMHSILVEKSFVQYKLHSPLSASISAPVQSYKWSWGYKWLLDESHKARPIINSAWAFRSSVA